MSPSTEAFSSTKQILHIEVWIDNVLRERRMMISTPRLTLGRAVQCDIGFAASESAVADVHAELTLAGDGYVLRALSAQYPLLLATGGEPVVLQELTLDVSALPVEVSLGVGGPVVRIWLGLGIPFADYIILGQLGEGGMATVFAAQESADLNRLVVLKLTAPGLSFNISQEEAEELLQEEARILAQINHPNVVNVYRVGRRDNTHYIAMEYLRGVSLSSIQVQLQQRQIRCPYDLAAALVGQACLGLHAAHEARDSSGKPLNIVHRDFTPSNLICSPDGDLKLIDFGVARALGRRFITESGMFVGKPAYASPEQISRPQLLDRRSDLFAAGVILYELCAGRSLFQRDSDFSTMTAVTYDPIPPIPGIPSSLRDIICSALSREPAGRPATAALLAEQLERIVLSSGGEYLQRRSIAQALRRLGVSMESPPPSSLVRRPTLLPKPSAAKQSAARELDRAAPARTARPEASTLRPVPAASPWRPPERIELLGESFIVNDVLYHHAAAGLPRYVHVCCQVHRAEAAAQDEPAHSERITQLHLIGGDELASPLLPQQAERMMSLCATLRTLPLNVLGKLVAVSGPSRSRHAHSLAVVYEGCTWAQRLLREALSKDERIALVQGLAAALCQVVTHLPAFVHGEICPSTVTVPASLKTDGPLPLQVLLGRSLEWLLGASPAPRGRLEQLPVDQTLYCAPELFRGEPPGHASDVFSVAAMAYEVLGGNLSAAVSAVRYGSRLPPLPPSSPASPAVREAIYSALRPGPALRPDAAEFARLLHADQAGGCAAPRELLAPRPGHVLSTEYEGRRRVHLMSLRLDRTVSRGPQPLPFDQVASLASVGLHLTLRRDALAVELLGGSEAASTRARLYPEGGHEGTVRILLRSGPCSFEVGSRMEQRLQRVEYQTAASGKSELLEISSLGLRLRSSRGSCLGALWTREPRTGDIYICCAQLAS
ncbi:MAG: protein kinase [Polyangia bacterium]